MTLHDIRRAVQRHFRLDMRKVSRKRTNVDAKRIYCYIARQHKYTFKEIAEYLNMNHATAVHHNKVATNWIKQGDTEIITHIDTIFNLGVAKSIEDNNETAIKDMFLDTLKEIPKDMRADALDRLKLIIKGYNWKSEDTLKVYESEESMLNYCF